MVHRASGKLKSSPPLGVGTQVAFVAQFLGRRLAYTYQLTSSFAKLAAPLMAAAMRRANRKDLAQLKAILERQPAHG